MPQKGFFLSQYTGSTERKGKRPEAGSRDACPRRRHVEKLPFLLQRILKVEDILDLFSMVCK